MNLALWLENLLVYSLQLGVLIAAGALLPLLLRLRAPGVRLAYFQALLVACLVLPFVQPWQPVPAAATVSLQGEGAAAAGVHALWPWQQALAFLLAAGVVFRGLWLVAGLTRLRRYRRRARPYPLPPALAPLAERIGTRCDFYLSADTDGPLTFGWWRPRVLLPAAFPSWVLGVQEAVVCHELLHVRRRDWAVTLSEEVVRSVLWFHPGIWWLLGRVRLAREQVVDRRAIDVTRSQENYLRALLEIVKDRVEPALTNVPAFLRRRQLRRRLDSICKEDAMSRSRLLLFLGVMLAVLVGAASLATWWFPLQASPAVHRVGEGIQSPRVLVKVEPTYTQEARDAGLEGAVVLSIEIWEDGRAHNIEVKREFGMGLTEQAIDAIQQWEFQPADKDGQAVKVAANVEMNFRLP